MIAALYVVADGPYTGIAGVDPWPEDRDARKYAGPYPVVAHSPCETWGKYAKRYGRVGQDGGCFKAALACVRKWGGVLEHPEGSLAFDAFKIPKPPARGWSDPDKFGGRSCLVYQGHYGHRAPKPTWLYKIAGLFPELHWGPTPPRDLSHLDSVARKRAIKTGICQRLSKRQRKLTPDLFRDLLIALASNKGVYTKLPVHTGVNRPDGHKEQSMQLEIKVLAGAESKAFLADLTKQIDRLERLGGVKAAAPAAEDADDTGSDDAPDADESDDDDFAAAPKNVKAAVKSAAKKTAASFDEDDADDAPAASTEDDDDADFTAPPAKAAKPAKAKKITVDDVNDACKAKASSIGGKEGRAKVLALLKKHFKTESVSELKPEQYEACIKAMAV